jgi:hypothetical protein
MEDRKLDESVVQFVVDEEQENGERIRRVVPPHGFLLLLVTPAMWASGWIELHFPDRALQDLFDRGVTVIPITVDVASVPGSIAHLQRFAIQSTPTDLDRLVGQVAVAPLIDLESMNPKLFESLVYDLLNELGFRDGRAPDAPRPPVGDFIVEFVSHDPFGSERTDTWLIEAKHSRQDRVSPFGVSRLAAVVESNRRFTKGLLVTNGRLTSSTRRALEDLEQKTGSSIRVIDGAELKVLLLQRPGVVARYFGAEVSAARANG